MSFVGDGDFTAQRRRNPSRDLEVIRSNICGVYGEFGPMLAFSQLTVDKFAELTGDKNPLHLDAVAAGSGPFGKRVTHGLFVLALTTGKLRPKPTFELEGVCPVLDGYRNIKFLRSVSPGDLIACREQVVEAEYVRHRGILVTSDFEVHLMTKLPTKIAVRGTIDVLYPEK